MMSIGRENRFILMIIVSIAAMDGGCLDFTSDSSNAGALRKAMALLSVSSSINYHGFDMPRIEYAGVHLANAMVVTATVHCGLQSRDKTVFFTRESFNPKMTTEALGRIDTVASFTIDAYSRRSIGAAVTVSRLSNGSVSDLLRCAAAVGAISGVHFTETVSFHYGTPSTSAYTHCVQFIDATKGGTAWDGAIAWYHRFHWNTAVERQFYVLAAYGSAMVSCQPRYVSIPATYLTVVSPFQSVVEKTIQYTGVSDSNHELVVGCGYGRLWEDSSVRLLYSGVTERKPLTLEWEQIQSQLTLQRYDYYRTNINLWKSSQWGRTENRSADYFAAVGFNSAVRFHLYNGIYVRNFFAFSFIENQWLNHDYTLQESVSLGVVLSIGKVRADFHMEKTVIDRQRAPSLFDIQERGREDFRFCGTLLW
ncbi:MAG: hypothetical protein JW795_20810 [Chitinivibrionales bacterium]|nr:hypothetical protein [Chitinivibrionales bacterium]